MNMYIFWTYMYNFHSLIRPYLFILPYKEERLILNFLAAWCLFQFVSSNVFKMTLFSWSRKETFSSAGSGLWRRYRGRSFGMIRSFFEMMIACSTTFSSSRTFPGHAWARKISMTSGRKLLTVFPFSWLNFWRKWDARRGISSFLSLKEGTKMGMTLSR